MSALSPHTKQAIGVLGGMGPETSIRFYKQLIDLARSDFQAVQDRDFPSIFINNLPLEDFDENGIQDVDTVKTQLIDGVKKLEQAGSNFIVIPCNSVHYFIEDMRNAINIEIVSIIEETVKSIDPQIKKVGVLSSASSRKFGLYVDELKKRGFEAISATDEEQEILNHLILQAMKDEIGKEEEDQFMQIMENMKARGAEVFIAGCTELSLIAESLRDAFPIYDGLEILTEKAIYKSYNAL